MRIKAIRVRGNTHLFGIWKRIQKDSDGMLSHRVSLVVVATLIGLGIAGSGGSLRSIYAQGSAQQLDSIFDNGNIEAVQNQPKQPTSFVVSEPIRLVSIKTYHWNAGRGAAPGTIAVRSSAGQSFGPWQAAGQAGQGGVPNAYWVATPNIDLGPGEYTVIDSDPSTWAQNDTSGGSGFAAAEGYVVGNAPPPAGSASPQPSPAPSGAPLGSAFPEGGSQPAAPTPPMVGESPVAEGEGDVCS